MFWVGAMIFVSVGTQLPFDRLVRTIDEWAQHNPDTEIVAQIGPSTYKAKAITTYGFIGSEDMRSLYARADLIVAHAGMGSILTALEFGKPILIMPRNHLRGEHRNAHQLATASRFRDSPGVYVADDETELLSRLGQIDSMAAPDHLPKKSGGDLMRRLVTFIETDKAKPPKAR
jgi:UDP-N-acetylglucosamine transferase subunit ALG13